MTASRLQHYLHEQHIPFEVIHHARSITAQETAASAHIHGQMLAKSVMVKLDGRLAMVVLPAHHRVHMGLLCRALGAGSVELASETEFCEAFPDCELGAMPPFGNLYGVDVYVDEALAGEPAIAFNAGSHTELVRMAYHEFERLVNPRHIRLERPT